MNRSASFEEQHPQIAQISQIGLPVPLLRNLRTNIYEMGCHRKEPSMPKYQKFEDLPVWQEAARLYNKVLDLLEEPAVPLSSGFRNQLDRAALSVSNNIAEGFERVTTNELTSFLAIARGSGGEVRSMMAVVKDRPKLKPFICR